MAPEHSILIVEDETHIADALVFLLKGQGYTTSCAGDGELAWAMFQRQDPDLVLLDLNLPGRDGLELFAMMRGLRADCAIVMVTARQADIDRILGLEMGADDYITKPFHNAELLARVRNVLRRVQPSHSAQTQETTLGPLQLKEEGHLLLVNGAPLHLARHEFFLMQTLMKHPAFVYSRDQLLDRMYGDEQEVGIRAVDAAVTRLRRKFSEVLPDQTVIESVYGLGYKLCADLGADE